MLDHLFKQYLNWKSSLYQLELFWLKVSNLSHNHTHTPVMSHCTDQTLSPSYITARTRQSLNKKVSQVLFKRQKNETKVEGKQENKTAKKEPNEKESKQRKIASWLTLSGSSPSPSPHSLPPGTGYAEENTHTPSKYCLTYGNKLYSYSTITCVCVKIPTACCPGS